MRILIAVNSFKGSLTSAEAGAAIAAGLKTGFSEIGIRADIDVVPTADGGDGTIEAFAAACGGEKIPVSCPGPLGDSVTADFLILPDRETAVIEMARCSGLTLVSGREDVLRSDTSGLGRLIRTALDRRAKRILIGLGGSATNDWGAGMAAELGARFLDADGRTLRPRPLDLARLRTVETDGLDPRLASVRFEILADVDNPLLGPKGAAAVFGPQKSADADALKMLEETGARYADAVEARLGRKYRDLPGAGAAGGLGFAAAAFLGATIRSGIEAIIEASGLKERARKSDLFITGEGRLDAQSRRGKTVLGIARLGRETRLPVVAFCGSIDGTMANFVPDPFAAAYAVRPEAASLEDAIARAAVFLEIIARRSARELSVLAVRP